LKEKLEQEGRVASKEEKVIMRRWKRMYRQQEEDLDVVRFGGVKHFIAGIPQPPLTENSDDKEGSENAEDADMQGEDPTLVIHLESENSGNLGKRKADDVNDSCKRVCGSGVSGKGVCKSTVVLAIQDVGSGVCVRIRRGWRSLLEKTRLGWRKTRKQPTLGLPGN
jgi:hypothetical protein